MKFRLLSVLITLSLTAGASAQTVVHVQNCAQLTQAFINAQAPGTLIGVARPGEITGLTFDGVGLSPDPGSGWNIHGNTFENTAAATPGTNPGSAIGGSGMTNSHVDHNSFVNVPNTGIFVYPGDNNTFDYNTFTNCNEAIHSMSGNNCDYSYNVVTGAKRNGIEIQSTGSNTSITHNWIGQFSTAPTNSTGGASHMAISAACGSGGNHITIADNTLLVSGVPGPNGLPTAGNNYALTGIEIMGSSVTVTGNYVSGVGGAIMNGCRETPDPVSSGNTFICVNAVEPDFPAGEPLTETGDKVYAWNDPNAPAAPPVAQTLGTATSQPAPSTGPAPATAPASPVGLTTGPASGQVTATFPQTTAQSPISLYASTLAPSTATPLGNVPVGATQAVIGGINDSWWVTAIVGGVASNSVQVTGSPVAAGAAFTPTLISTNAPSSAASVVHTVQTLSNGKIAIDGGAAQ